MNRQTVVYRCFDASGVLLYIGRTLGERMQTRWREHRNTQPWWPEVTRIDLAFYDDPGEAFREERRAILAEYPRHNKERHPVIPAKAHLRRVWAPLPGQLAARITAASRRRSRTKPRTPGRNDELAALVYEALSLGCQPGPVSHAAHISYEQARRLAAYHLTLHPEAAPIPPRRSLKTAA